MKIVAVSDTHTYGRNHKELPEADIFIHAGDLTFRGILEEIYHELSWIESLPYKHKLVVAGNHDFYFDERFSHGIKFRNWRINRSDTIDELLTTYPSITYLQDSGIEIEGIKFWGTPWQPWYYGWAFQPPMSGKDGVMESFLKEKFDLIPKNTNILISHGPPAGILDDADDAYKLGSPELLEAINNLPDLKVHIFGHIHESYGKKEINKIKFYNVASCNIDYDKNNLNPPVIIEI